MNLSLEHKKVLLIDDVSSIRHFVRLSVESLGADCFEAQTALEGLALVSEKSPELVILDLGLPDRDGLDILSEIKSRKNPPKVIILSVRKDPAIIDRALNLGADAYLNKPFTMEMLFETMSECTKQLTSPPPHLVKH